MYNKLLKHIHFLNVLSYNDLLILYLKNTYPTKIFTLKNKKKKILHTSFGQCKCIRKIQSIKKYYEI